eukprot:275041_1
MSKSKLRIESLTQSSPGSRYFADRDVDLITESSDKMGVCSQYTVAALVALWLCFLVISPTVALLCPILLLPWGCVFLWRWFVVEHTHMVRLDSLWRPFGFAFFCGSLMVWTVQAILVASLEFMWPDAGKDSAHSESWPYLTPSSFFGFACLASFICLVPVEEFTKVSVAQYLKPFQYRIKILHVVPSISASIGYSTAQGIVCVYVAYKIVDDSTMVAYISIIIAWLLSSLTHVISGWMTGVQSYRSENLEIDTHSLRMTLAQTIFVRSIVTWQLLSVVLIFPQSVGLIAMSYSIAIGATLILAGLAVRKDRGTPNCYPARMEAIHAMEWRQHQGGLDVQHAMVQHKKSFSLVMENDTNPSDPINV